MNRKGIILAGGTGSRLHPLTISVSKQLMPVYDKPLIYYPLAALMQANIRDILVITTPQDQVNFQSLLGDGSKWGISISYAVQPSPDGLAQAFIIGREFIGNDCVTLVLGDNIFLGAGIAEQFAKASAQEDGATVFAYHVKDPERYGVVSFSTDGTANSLEEKPENPKSSYAVTGLYFYDNSVVERALEVKPSKRGELEITDLNQLYLNEQKLYVERMGRGVAWLDTGTHESLLEAAQFVEILERRQGLRVCCPEEIAYDKAYISDAQLESLAEALGKNSYGEYLYGLLHGTEK